MPASTPIRIAASGPKNSVTTRRPSLKFFTPPAGSYLTGLEACWIADTRKKIRIGATASTSAQIRVPRFLRSLRKSALNICATIVVDEPLELEGLGAPVVGATALMPSPPRRSPSTPSRPAAR